MREVYITGVTGTIGRYLAEDLSSSYRIRGNSRSGAPVKGAEVARGDVRDLDFMTKQLEGVDTLIHLGADPSVRATWDSALNNNIDGAQKVYEAARLAGVKRVIFASSNHVTGILTEKVVDMDADTPMRPDSYYGISKAAGELIGRYYSDRYGISVLNFRIGWIGAWQTDEEIVNRFKGIKNADPLMWLSRRDCAQAHRCGIEAPREIAYGTYYIMSNNKDMLWDLTNAKKELGYEPQDDLAELFARFGEPYDFRIPR